MLPLRDNIPSRSVPLVNWALIATNVVVFIYQTGLKPLALHNFINAYGVVPAHLSLTHPSTWIPLVTAIFLHGGWFHLISNMWVLFIFGDNVEERMGGLSYLLFYLLSGVAAALLQSFLMPSSSEPMIGASGAIAGVLGAYLILFPHARVASLVPILFIFTVIQVPATLFLLFWFVSQLFSGWLAIGGSAGSGVAWWAHVGGFLFGILTVFLFARRRIYHF